MGKGPPQPHSHLPLENLVTFMHNSPAGKEDRAERNT